MLKGKVKENFPGLQLCKLKCFCEKHSNSLFSLNQLNVQLFPSHWAAGQLIHHSLSSSSSRLHQGSNIINKFQGVLEIYGYWLSVSTS